MAILVGCVVSMQNYVNYMCVGYYHLNLPVGGEDLRVRNLSLESKVKDMDDIFLPAFRSC